MYCKFCGEEISGEGKFCSKCGKGIQISEEKKKAKAFDAKIIACVLVAVAVIIGLIIWLSSASKYVKVDMSKLYQFEFSGLDGDGIVTAEINQIEWSNITDEVIKEGDSAETSRMMSLMMLEYTFSKDKSLSNGDEITFTINVPDEYEERYKFKIANTDQKIKVDGLVVPEEVDVFEGLKLEFTGRSPYITCNIITGGCNEFTQKYVKFDTTEYYYSAGDVVEVVASYDDSVLLEEAVKVVNDKAEYEAESKEAYLDSLENVDLTQLNQAIYNQLQLEYSAADELFAGVELGWTNHYTDLKNEEHKGSVFLALRDKYDFEEDVPYNIYAVYYRDKIGVEHRSRGNEGTFETEIDLLLIANNLYVDENKVLHYDDLIQVRANEVESMADLKSVYIKEMQDEYYVMESATQE